MKKNGKLTVLICMGTIVVCVLLLILFGVRNNYETVKTSEEEIKDATIIAEEEKGSSDDNKVAVVENNKKVGEKPEKSTSANTEKERSHKDKTVIAEPENSATQKSKTEDNKQKKSKDNNKDSDYKKNNNESSLKDEKEEKIPDNNSCVLYVTDVEASPGDKDITVEVKTKRNPGILGMVLSLSYDDSDLTLKKATCGNALEGTLDFTKAKSFESGCRFTWDGVELPEDSIKDGTVLKLEFEVSAKAKNGKYPIGIAYEEGDIVDGKLIPIEPEIVNGSIIIK